VIVSEKDCGAEVPPRLSFTVTAKLKGLPTLVVGVPVITPVPEFKLSPGGSEPEATTQLPYGGVPPVATRLAV
jgi:hypothetical protein